MGRKLVLSWLSVFLSLWLAACTKDQSIDPVDAADLEAFVAGEMESQHVSAVSVTLFREASLLYHHDFGLADRENNVALNPSHMFLVASVSKTITAAALMQLHEQGHFQLDDPINDHLPFEVKHPDSGTKITFRHLLTHTSGIEDSDALDDAYYYGIDSPVSLGDFLRDYLSPTGNLYDAKANFTKFTPGEGYEYSNTGAALMGLLVTEISGIDFNDYCKQHIFQPLGMTHTFWHLGETDTMMVVRPYEYRRGEYTPIQHYTFTDYPNGGLRTNGTDLAKFAGAISLGGILGNVRILETETVDEMLQEQIPDLEAGQGLSFYQVENGVPLWGHDGGEQGVTTVMAFNPANQTGAIILSNASDANLEDIVLSAYRLALKL